MRFQPIRSILQYTPDWFRSFYWKVSFWRSYYNPKTFYQRGRYGYSRYDLIDFGDYVADVCARGLREFQKDNNGSPLRFEENPHEKWDGWIGGGFDKWQEYIGKMARAFELQVKLVEGDEMELTKEEEIEKQEGLRLFAESIGGLWW